MENNAQNRPMTVGDWFVTILILAIPLLNIVMYLYWALSSTGNLNRKNFCIASLIWMLIGIAIAVLVIGFVSLIGVAAMSH
ncbi:MAG: hypothetical protein GXO70_02530 [Acidobacteria bacterium]|nr:hypothetical protein [Acidobacteriota bacterium]